MRVQVCLNFEADTLTRCINDYLLELERKGWELHDIKYSITNTPQGRIAYSALIIYKPK